MFETFEEEGTHYVKGSVFVVAILDRHTLKLKGYIEQAFMSYEQAVDYERDNDLNPEMAYIVQEKELVLPIYRSGE